MKLESSLAEAEIFEHSGRKSDAWQRHLRAQAAAFPLFQRQAISLSGQWGQAVLAGVVSSYYEKQLAQEFARRFEGVVEIDNHLEVRYRQLAPCHGDLG